MREAGATVRHPGEAFPLGAHDKVWLSKCGTRGWIVLMRDQRIRRRPLELAALTGAGVAAFVCTAGQATAGETANTVTRLLPRFVNIVTSETKPLLYTFGLSGSLNRVRLKTSKWGGA